MRGGTRRTRVGVAAAAAALLALLLLDRLVLNAALTFVRMMGVALPLIGLVLVLGAYARVADRLPMPAVRAVQVVGVVIGLSATTLAFGNGYLRDAAIYNASAHTVTGQAVADYDQRAPFTVARARAASQVTSNGTLNDTTYLADRGTFGTAVAAQGAFAGYAQVVEQSIDLDTGTIETTSCEFDRSRAAMRLGGLLRHSLDRQIIAAAGYGTTFDPGDSYAYCDGDRPVVVVPLTRYTGLVGPHRVPAGVALYDGHTGQVTVDRDPTDVPGPVYPLSLAEQQRQSLHTADGWWRYMVGQAGYALPASPSPDGGEGNVSEYNLALADGSGAEYVSSLVPLQDGTRVVAVAAVPSTHVTAGELNPLTVTVLTPGQQRDADVTVAQQVRNTYQSLGWASGLEVFEVAPVGDHLWAVTIGYTQELAYRVLYDSQAEQMTITTVGGATPPAGDTDSGSGDTGGAPQDLGALTDTELADLLERVTDEVAERMRGDG